MALYDDSVSVQALPSVVANSIKAWVQPADQLISLIPNALFIVIHDDTGYVFLLRPQSDTSTMLRLLVDSAEVVRTAFRGKPPKEAVTALIRDHSTDNPLLADQARRYLAACKTAFENRPPSTVAFPDPAPFTTSLSDQSDLAVAGSTLGEISQAAPVQEKRAQPEAAGLKPLPEKSPFINIEKAPYGDPWNPDFLAAMIVVLLIFPGIAMSINWRRLGKPQWLWDSLLIVVIVFIVSILALFVLVPKMAATPALTPLLPLILGANYGLAYGLAFVQRGAYQKWRRTGDVQAMLAHNYNFTGGALLGIGIAALFTGVVTLLLSSSSQPQTYDSADMTIKYPSVWRTVDISQSPDCKSTDLYCIMAVGSAPFNSTVIFVSRLSLPTAMSADEVQANTWQSMEKQFPGAAIKKVYKRKVSGLIGSAREYTLPPQGANSHDSPYGLQIYVVKGMVTYQITAGSLNAPIFDQERPSIDSFLDGIQFK